MQVGAPSLGIVIPVGPREKAEELDLLLERLEGLEGYELFSKLEVLVCLHEESTVELSSDFSFKSQRAGKSRAQQMNQGAAKLNVELLAFLHLDSLLPDNLLAAVSRFHELYPEELGYFDLFFHDGPALMKLNEFGVQFRSDILGTPFGDQCFVLSKSLFNKLGAYDEACKYGEDHLLAWKAWQEGVTVRSLKARLGTSARKYSRAGWLKMTWKHFLLTWKQALPEWRKLRLRKAKLG